jgi:hypothetical protein
MVAKRACMIGRKQMACGVERPVKMEVALNTNGQTSQSVHEVVEALLRMNGVIECGIMAYFSIGLGEGSAELGADPGPELKRHGVISLKTTRDE